MLRNHFHRKFSFDGNCRFWGFAQETVLMPSFSIGSIFSVGGDGPSSGLSTIKTQYNFEIITLGPVQPEHIKYVQEVQLPNFSTEIIEILGSAIKYKFASSIAWDDVAIKFYDVGMAGGGSPDQATTLLTALRQWYDNVWNPQRGLGSPTDYKQDVEIHEVDDLDQVVNKYVLKGAFPQSISHGPLSYATSDAKIIDLVLTYDYPEINDNQLDKN